MKVLSPRESGAFIAKNAKHLEVLPEGIENLTKEIVAGILSKDIAVENFSQHQLHPKPTDPHAIEWIFFVDTLNFCFWTPTNYTKYKVLGHTGYFALCAAVNRALAEGIDITNSKIYSQMDAKTLTHIFRSDDGETQIPLLEKRVECLHEVGSRLIEKWDGKFENIVRSAEKSAVRLLELIVQEFTCFRDEADYMGQRVSLYKRAQILVGDVWSCFRAKGLGNLEDLYEITMFADYRVPQVLIHFGTMKYKPELWALLKEDTILENGDSREVEIRGASIYIVEEVKDAVLLALKENHPEVSKDNVNSILIDQYLWDYRRKHALKLEHIPFHKTLSIYY